MTRMPLVCISMVASAFQYGWAPTLMPATMTLISPPSWVKVMIRRSARDTQSMFSVPLAIEMVAPEDSANHSTGTDSFSARSIAATTRRAFGFGDGAQCFGGVAEQRDPGHALGVAVGRAGHHADDQPGGVASVGAVHRDQRAGVVEVVFDEAAVGAGEQRDQFVGVDGAAGLGALHLLGVFVQRAQRLGRGGGHGGDDAGPGAVGEADRDAARLGGRRVGDSRPGW